MLDPRLEQARTHWAFQPLRAVEPPAVKDDGWVRTPIDRFILAALEAKGLAPSPPRRCWPADPPRVVRRDRPAADARTEVEHRSRRSTSDDRRGRRMTALVDRLLASRHYGERWGRHWLDVARYADSDG